MKNQLKKLKDIDFLTKLTLSEQEKINGGNGGIVTENKGSGAGNSVGFSNTSKPTDPIDPTDPTRTDPDLNPPTDPMWYKPQTTKGSLST